MRQHKERFENLPEDVRVNKASDDAGFISKVSPGQCFVTIHDIELAGFGCAGSCREYTSLRDDKRSNPKGWIRGNTEIGPVLKVKATNYLERVGIEVKIGSMRNDGSQSWIVISRGIDKYVTVLPEENEKPIHNKEVASSAGKLVAKKPGGVFCPSHVGIVAVKAYKSLSGHTAVSSTLRSPWLDHRTRWVSGRA